jgi:6-phosphogluconolactonase
MKPEIYSSPQALGQAAANYVSQVSARAVAERGRFSVAISGGSLPKLLGPPLAVQPLRSQIEWSAWHVFWADERCVPLAHTDSNYRLAREYLFDHVPIPADQIYAIDDARPPGPTAEAYQGLLRQLFQPGPGQIPRFDLILLGMGEDGHTASLFPGHPLLTDTDRWVASILDSPKPPPERISLTLPLINQARHIAFLAAGQGKAAVLSEVFGPTDRDPILPVQLVHPAADGELVWFVDRAAAMQLGE